MVQEEPGRLVLTLSLAVGGGAFASGTVVSVAAAWAASGFGNPLAEAVVLDVGLAASAVAGLVAGAAFTVLAQLVDGHRGAFRAELERARREVSDTPAIAAALERIGRAEAAAREKRKVELIKEMR